MKTTILVRRQHDMNEYLSGRKIGVARKTGGAAGEFNGTKFTSSMQRRLCLFLKKLFLKYFYIYLLLKKLINGKYF